MTTEPNPELHPETVAIRSGRVGDATSLAPVLWPTSTFVSPSVDDARRFATSVAPGRLSSAVASASAVADWRATRIGSVRMPRVALRASYGEADAPCRTAKPHSQSISSRLPATTPRVA